MAELLLELCSEEIPARMQRRAAEELKRLIMEALAAAGLGGAAAQAFVTPRRLTIVVEGVPAAQADVAEERKGPRVGAPAAAIQGFLKAAGLERIEDAELRDTGKGVFHFAVTRRPGRPASVVLSEILPPAILALPWPKSMRWGAHALRWIRPLHRVLCLLDGDPLPLRIGHLEAGAETVGHRFLAPAVFRVRGFADYRTRLSAAYVMLDAADRRRTIAEDARRLAAAETLKLVEDPGLLEEVAGLVEWPVVLSGRIDPAFMDVPREVLTTAMRSHQKYFSLETADGRLAPRFILVANQLAEDGGRQIVAGNERVLKARLADARFFWDQDRRHRLETRLPALKSIVFHARLGTLAEKAERLQALAERLAGCIPGADPARARRAAALAKADLVSDMVGEFPELQGVMGRYYAAHDGEAPEVAEAIAEHYAPQGPSDRCPAAPVSVAVALADRLDTLAGFFLIDEKPTGSRDPFALRRAALGVIRLIVENALRIPLQGVLCMAVALQRAGTAAPADAVVGQILEFFADRLKVHLRERGVRHDLVSAVFALGGEDDLVRLLKRVEALQGFLAGEDGANLLVAYRRAANILRIEEKKDGVSYTAGAVEPALLQQDEERSLDRRLAEVASLAGAALAAEDFNAAAGALARLRRPVDAFFDRVTVNAAEPELRANRLRLLARIRAELDRVADFSRIEG